MAVIPLSATRWAEASAYPGPNCIICTRPHRTWICSAVSGICNTGLIPGETDRYSSVTRPVIFPGAIFPNPSLTKRVAMKRFFTIVLMMQLPLFLMVTTTQGQGKAKGNGQGPVYKASIRLLAKSYGDSIVL